MYAHKREKKPRQMSESLLVGLLLAFSGGLMDAYTYVLRDHVFANAQTGNIILFAISLFEGSTPAAVRYLLPILSFTLGVLSAQGVRLRFGQAKFHWRQGMLLFEIAVLLIVAFIPTTYNLPANCMVSLVCGIQMQSFQKIRGNALATTMCVGNLRTATGYLCSAVYLKDRALLKRAGLYYGVIVVFALGAVCGNFLVRAVGQYAIFMSVLLLSTAFALLFIRKTDKEEKENP